MKVIKKGFINNNKEYVLEIKSENEIKKIDKNFKLQKKDELIKNKTQNIFTSEIHEFLIIYAILENNQSNGNIFL